MMDGSAVPAGLGLVLAVRWLHVAAMAIVLGGACLISYAALATHASPSTSGAAAGGGAFQPTAVAYERLFWAAIGILAASGVGNAAAFGASLPTAQTGWGFTFTVKLCAVLGLLALSLVRTLVVSALSASTDSSTHPRRDQRVLGGAYLATASAAAIVLALANRLAHGSA
jgi:uncharacterized membrane protein